MRQILKLAAPLVLFSAFSIQLSADPIVGGYVLDRLPGAKNAVIDGKNVVLAHLFNPDQNTLKAGSFDVGVEIQSRKGIKTYVLKPNADLPAGTMKTFRMKVPLNEISDAAVLRVFARLGGRKIWSDVLGDTVMTAGKTANEKIVTTLFTEAPPEPKNEPVSVSRSKNEKSAVQVSQSKSAGKPAALAAAPATEKQNSFSINKKSESQIVPAAIETAKTNYRTIDPSEFKTLKTIDEELIIYVVKAGDSLKAIAERYYGNAAQAKIIADLNFIDENSSVKPGEEIIVDVRPLNKTKSVALSADNFKEPAVAGAKKYVVQSGDTPAGIAKHFYGKASKVNLLLKANPGIDPKNLKIGTELLIPVEAGDKA